MEVDFEKFKRNFESLWKTLTEQKERAARDSAGFARDKQLAATAASSSAQPPLAAMAMQLVWEGSNAQKRLRTDMQRNLHVTMTPKDLWQSHSDYHEPLGLRTF
jgi:hypothetical protein